MRCKVPAAAGIGLRAPHVRHVLATEPAVPWFEVHSENYFADGGEAIRDLERIRERYAVALHGVGLSLGSTDPLDRGHLARLKALVKRIRPGMVSEHLSWGSLRGRHFNDLLPLPYTEESLRHVALRVDQVQEALGQRILVENISAYHRFPESTIGEADFLVALAERTSCRLLLDVNNLHVSEHNVGLDAQGFIERVPCGLVAEVHLAGHEARDDMLVDTHGTPVSERVWQLFERVAERFGPLPTLIEWDNDLPAFAALQAEAARAQAVLERDDAVAA